MAFARQRLFIPEDKVQDQTATWKAFRDSETWPEFWRTLPPHEATEIRSYLEVTWADKDAACQDWPYDGDAELDWWVLPGVDDGDWPPILSREITDWLPRSLLNELGELDEHSGVSSGPASGSFLTIGEEVKFERVIATFAAHGYRLVPDPELVATASGWWWENNMLTSRPEES